MTLHEPVVDMKDAKKRVIAMVGPGYKVDEGSPRRGPFFEDLAKVHAKYFVFSVCEVPARRVGWTRYVGVTRATGQVIELGRSGE